MATYIYPKYPPALQNKIHTKKKENQIQGKPEKRPCLFGYAKLAHSFILKFEQPPSSYSAPYTVRDILMECKKSCPYSKKILQIKDYERTIWNKRMISNHRCESMDQNLTHNLIQTNLDVQIVSRNGDFTR